MEVEKIKDIDKPQEFNEKEKPEITPEMKYIKWPKKGKVTPEMVSVLLSLRQETRPGCIFLML